MLDLIGQTASNVLSPAILFFILGLLAGLAQSDLSIPREATGVLALYLMLAIGFRGGVELAHAGFSWQMAAAAGCGVALGLVIPLVAFAILTTVGRLDPTNAGAIAAHYGSISAVTFVTTIEFLNQAGAPFEGFMVAVMALMETPGIIVGILLAKVYRQRGSSGVPVNGNDLRRLAREALFGGSVVLLLGSFAIGALTGEKGMAKVSPFVVDLFPGALAVFLLDMGLTTARRLGEFFRLGRFLVGFGIVMPLIGGSLGVTLGSLVGLSPGGSTLLALLAASASYIVAPAAVRLSLPQANPSLSMTLSLGTTFPFNILLGIPLFYTLAQALAGT